MLSTLAVPLIILIVILIKQVNEYQRGVMFTLGKYSGMKNPGWRIVIPVFQRMIKVDLRTKVVDVPDQEAITKDNISIRINAVIYYKVSDAAKSIIEVENFYFAVSQLAQTTMRNAVGETTLDELLRNRDEIAGRIQIIVDKASDPWGIKVEAVELKDIGLPDNMKRTMAKEA
ncbi:slipin family protein, partial [Patescibacteria group bacterium]|nr:slipin family protein [Patescibacteria group bacterium]